MMEITSSQNPLIKEIKTLYKKKGRLKSRAFIIEGIKMVEEALENSYPIRYIIYTEGLSKTKDGEIFLAKIGHLKNLIFVPNNIFREISDTDNPQGILAIANIQEKNIEEVHQIERPFLIYLDEIQDPGNMGTIIRTADAFKADGIIMTEGCVDPYNPKVVRATMGSIFRVPIYIGLSGINDLQILKDKGISIYSTSLEGSNPIYEVDYNKGFIFVIGNESNGVSKEIQDLSTELIKIPMPGKAESLNAGVAASIIMYEVMKQRCE